MEWLLNTALWLFNNPFGKWIFLGLVFTMPVAAVLTLMERRQSAYSQDRYGPQRAHFLKFRGKPIVLFGLLHIVADGFKTIFKESVTPALADKLVFPIAPLLGFATSLIILALIPFGPDVAGEAGTVQLQIARVDSGILWVFAVGSLGVYGAALAGWSSNNRFGLLGGLRASAQGISYEIALGLTVVGVLIMHGTTELSEVVAGQGGMTFFGALPAWGIFTQPLGAVLFFIAATAETKRTPFDLPEGESEIIGYFVEYSSMDFGLFMLGEFVEIVVLAMMFTTLFLGGWQAPFLGGGVVDLYFVQATGFWYGLAGFLVFAVKTVFVCLLQLQLRWTLPRFRYDQLMRLGWKTLLPFSLINIFATAGLILLDPSLELLTYVGVGLIAIFLMVVIAGPRRRPAAAGGH